MKYALLSYRNTENLGDEIQSLAARRFLPRVDALVDRDSLSEWRGEAGDTFGLILNGWFADRPERWPPAPSFVPLFVSFHLGHGATLGRTGFIGADVILDPAMTGYLREWGPIGARDLATLHALEAADVPAYLSGCLTLTLQRAPGVERGDDVVLVDLPPQAVERIRASTDRDVVLTAHRDLRTSPAEARLARAEQLLDRYQRAHCVITSRLHAALPCLAYETPVVLVEPDYEPDRLAGLRELLRHCTTTDVVDGRLDFDINEPAPNDLDYLSFRRELDTTVTTFVARLEAGTLGAQPSAVGPQERLNTLWGLLARARDEREALVQRVHELEAERDARALSEPASQPAAPAPSRSALRATLGRVRRRVGTWARRS